MEEIINKDPIIKSLEDITMHDLNNKLKVLVDKEILQEYEKFSGNNESKIIIESVIKSYKIFLEMIDRECFIEAFGILRSIFEELLMCVVIDKYEEMYKLYLKIDRSKEEIKKISPSKVRSKASKVFKKFGIKQVNWDKEFNDYYQTLCFLVHPSILKNYFFGISNSKYKKENIKIIIYNIGLFCKYLLLFFLKYKAGEQEIEKFYDIYVLNQLIKISTMEEKNDIDKILKENEKYLHLDINNELLNNNEKNVNNIIGNNEVFDYKKLEESIKYMYIVSCAKCFNKTK